MEEWLSHSTDFILIGIFVMLLLINSNITNMVRKITNKQPQPTAEQLQNLIEQVNHIKWHVGQIRQHIKYGESEEESELKKEAEWLKTFKE